MWDIILETLIDSVKMLPFLFLAYLIIEYVEHRSSSVITRILTRSGKTGPIGGALLGCFPQCGFSVMAANLYADRLIPIGTFLAVLISTSDEAIPVLLANPGSFMSMWKIILTKVLIAVVLGVAANLFFSRSYRGKNSGGRAAHAAADREKRTDVRMKASTHSQGNACTGQSVKEHFHEEGHPVSEDEHLHKKEQYALGDETHAAHHHHGTCTCGGHDHGMDAGHTVQEDGTQTGGHAHSEPQDIHCGCAHHRHKGGIFRGALQHTVNIFVFILIVTLLMNIVMAWLGEERLSMVLMSDSIFQPAIAGIIGLIPNCAASVVLTELYLAGSISFGAIIAGLTTSVGVGFVVLFKTNRNIKENLGIMAAVYLAGVLIGTILQVLGVH